MRDRQGGAPPELKKIYRRSAQMAITNSPQAFAAHMSAEIKKLVQVGAVSIEAAPARGLLAQWRIEWRCRSYRSSLATTTSPLTERKDYSWPGGKRLAFCITTNVEVYRLRQGPRPRQRQARRAADAAQLLVARLRQPHRHLAAVRSRRRARHAARAQRQQPALRPRAADHGAHPRARRRDRRPRPHQLREPAGFPLGGGRGARDPRGDRDVRAPRRQAAQGLDGRGRLREPAGRPIC